MKKISLGKSGYPELLAQIPDPPKTLYCLGKYGQNVFANCLAVVGTRRMSEYGEEVVEELVGPVACAGVTIVSGFMYGVDTKAHEVCLEAGGATIAVLGCGIDLVVPRQNRELKEKIIASGGLVLSEHSGNYPPLKWVFVRRNRIVTGLSKAVLVVEAGEKSGALLTAKIAQKQGRKVLVVPGPINSQVSAGVNTLVKSGAQVVTSAEEILSALGISAEEKKKLAVGAGANEQEKQVLAVLRERRMGLDELAREMGVAAGELGAILTFLQLKNWVKERGGKYYVG